MSLVKIWAHKCDRCSVVCYQAQEARLISEPSPNAPGNWAELKSQNLEQHFCSQCTVKVLAEVKP